MPLGRRAGDTQWAVTKLEGRRGAAGRLRSGIGNLLPATANLDSPALRNTTGLASPEGRLPKKGYSAPCSERKGRHLLIDMVGGRVASECAPKGLSDALARALQEAVESIEPDCQPQIGNLRVAVSRPAIRAMCVSVRSVFPTASLDLR